ncbi:MAG: hypothetical protein HQM06_16390 [Magnetococcales bacterium]|nr:hypothetical protein [Magnetococcales bacterium]
MSRRWHMLALFFPPHWPDEMRLSRWWLALFPVALAGREAFEWGTDLE